jgi:hypothetical protein
LGFPFSLINSEFAVDLPASKPTRNLEKAVTRSPETPHGIPRWLGKIGAGSTWLTDGCCAIRNLGYRLTKSIAAASVIPALSIGNKDRQYRKSSLGPERRSKGDLKIICESELS